MAAIATPPVRLTLADRVALRIAVALEVGVIERIERRRFRDDCRRADVADTAWEQCAMRAHLLGIRR